MILLDESEVSARAWLQELRTRWDVSFSSAALERHIGVGLLYRERIGLAPSGRGQTSYLKRREFIAALLGEHMRKRRTVAAGVAELQRRAGEDRKAFLIECVIEGVELEAVEQDEAKELLRIEESLVESALYGRAAFLRRARSVTLLDFLQAAYMRANPDLPELPKTLSEPWPFEFVWPLLVLAAHEPVRETAVQTYEREVELYETVRAILGVWLRVPRGQTGTAEIEGFDLESGPVTLERLQAFKGALLEELGRALREGA